VSCGDGTLNATAGEICEPVSDEPWDRCALCEFYGAGLDGTVAATFWEYLVDPEAEILSFQSFHYSGMPYLYDFYFANRRYDIAADSWTDVKGDDAIYLEPVRNAAVDSTGLWAVGDGWMNRFDFATETWTSLPGTIPSGGDDEQSAAVFDGEGYIWYHAPKGLVRYDPLTDTATAEIEHEYIASFWTRLAYDPIGHKIAFGGYISPWLLVYDIAKGTFTQSANSPGGPIETNSCGDNSGGMYTGSWDDENEMYRYDIATDTWTEIPDLPVPHDNLSTCVVSQDGYLYAGTAEGPSFFRLPLGKLK
jgi:hypothetical protein